MIKKNIVYKEINSQQLTGDLYTPKRPGKKPAVMVIHGGSWASRNGGMTFICWLLARAGFVVFNVTYRLAPADLYPKAVEDLKDALLFLRANAEAFEINPNEISTWGYSAGGHLALLLGLNPTNKIKKIVAGAAPADFLAWPKSPIVGRFLGHPLTERRDLWEEASPVNQVHADSPPVFLYHGIKDTLVEVEQSYKMAAALKAKNVQVQVQTVSYAGHILLYIASPQSIRSGIRFLKED